MQKTTKQQPPEGAEEGLKVDEFELTLGFERAAMDALKQLAARRGVSVEELAGELAREQLVALTAPKKARRRLVVVPGGKRP